MSTSLPDIEAIERAGLKAWPGIEEKWDGSWVRRAAGGYTKRANSVQCLDPDDFEDADLRVISACTWMIIRQVKPVFRITPLAPYELSATLDESGWQTIGASHVYAMALDDREADPQAEFLSLGDPRFLAAQQKLRDYDAATLQGLQNLTAAIKTPATGIVLTRDGEAVASAIMAIADGIVVAGNVITDSTRRRQGLGKAMMNSGFAWARREGAHAAAVNVEAGNTAALALYSGLGYAHQYDYHYRIPGAPK
jgi:GNAT superfamily N-acetyltransferase